MDPQDISFEHLPPLQVEDVRERVRTGEELSIGSLSLGYIAADDPNILTKLREFSAQELIVYHDSVVLGRLERHHPSPLPEEGDRLLALCQGHTHTIRSRCNAVLRILAEKENALRESPSQQAFFHRLTQGTRLALVTIEQSLQRIRYALEAVLYEDFLHDTFHDEEFFRQLEKHIHEQYGQEKQLLTVLEQPLGLP